MTAGSQVTGLSPFQIWLNEAVTVHIQRKREHLLFGDDFRRLYEVLISFRPGVGPLAQDESAVAMPIEPVGFNRTQELISMMTYVESVRAELLVDWLVLVPYRLHCFPFAQLHEGSRVRSHDRDNPDTSCVRQGLAPYVALACVVRFFSFFFFWWWGNCHEY